MDNKTERLLEAYFAHALTQAEMTEIKMMLAEDPGFAAEFAWRQSLERAVRTGADNDPFKIRLQELERRFRFKKITLQITALAAVFLIAIFAVWFISQNQSSPQVDPNDKTVVDEYNSAQKPLVTVSPHDSVAVKKPSPAEKDSLDAVQKLEEQRAKQRALKQAAIASFLPYENIAAGMNRASGVPDAKQKAMNAFVLYDQATMLDESTGTKNGKEKAAYKEAAQALKQIAEDEPGNLEYQFYAGVASIGAEQFEPAAKLLQPVAEKPGKYQDPAKFYLGLAQAGAGQFGAARQAFKNYLATPTSAQFGPSAESMLKKLPPQ